MPKPTKKSRKIGVWIPRKIQKETRLSWQGKCLYAFFWSFGAKGCWMTNEQIGREWGCKAQTIKRIISNLYKAGLLDIVAGKSKYRKIFAKDHPAVKAHQREYMAQKEAETKKKLRAVCRVYNEEEVRTLQREILRKRERLQGQKLTATNKHGEREPNMVKSEPVEGQKLTGNRVKSEPLLKKNTNKNTIKHGEPSPLPAEGQAQASPQRQKPTKDEKLRSIKMQSEVEQQVRNFGKGPPKISMSEKEFAERRERQRKALGV
ncbi:MAG: hypothetical protein ACYS1A_16500 [Planctomycetota bacterium]|jgi:DNA-binding MarR family transcriptional regulator